MSEQVKSQILGLMLALMTALGCIVYERLVKNFSFAFLALLMAFSKLFVCCVGGYPWKIGDDLQNLSRYWLAAAAFVVLEVVAIFWYKITKEQGVLVGGVYEIKYVVILALIYIAMGDRPVTANMFIGLALAVCSVYFISK